MNTEIQHSKIFTEIINSNKRILALEGSARSTKTYSIIQYLIVKALSEKNQIIRCYRLHLPAVRATILIDFLDIIKNHFKIFNRSSWNKTELTYTFPNGSIITFNELADPEKLHGRKAHYSWINEVMECSYDSYAQVATRTEKQIILDWNPSKTKHWVFDRVLRREDVLYNHSTYKDNLFLLPEQRKEIERLNPDIEENVRNGTYDEVKWKVYGLGIRAQAEGLIYKPFKIINKHNFDMEFEDDCYGLDFGWNNPSALVRVGLKDQECYLEEILYQSHLTNGDLIEKLKEIIPFEDQHRKIPLYCDNAEPARIEEIQRAGFNAVAADKNVKDGIDFCKRIVYYTLSRCKNLTDESEQYQWKKDRDGTTLDEPTKLFDHLMDAMRYAIYSHFVGKIGGPPVCEIDDSYLDEIPDREWTY